MTLPYTHPEYVKLPDLEAVPSYVKDIAKERCLTNLMLLFLDFHTTEEDFKRLQEGDFERSNLKETVADLQHYGFNAKMPTSADEYRHELYPILMKAHAKAGYNGLQIPTGSAVFDDDGVLTDAAIDLLKLQKQITEEAGLTVSAVGGAWDADWKRCFKPQIQAANVLGSKYLYGPYATTFLYFPEGSAYGPASMDWVRRHIDNFSEFLQQTIGPVAREHGVVICDEPLQRFERMPIRLKEAVDLALKANIDEFKIMIDMCHEFADGEGPAIYKGYVDTLAKHDKLHGVHISAVHRGQVYESWFNQEYFQDFFKPIIENGYTGEIAIETFDATEPVMEPALLNRDKFGHPVGVLINQIIYSATMIGNVQVEKSAI